MNIYFYWNKTMPAHDVVVKAVYETGIAEIVIMAQQGLVRILVKLDDIRKFENQLKKHGYLL